MKLALKFRQNEVVNVEDVLSFIVSCINENKDKIGSESLLEIKNMFKKYNSEISSICDKEENRRSKELHIIDKLRVEINNKISKVSSEMLCLKGGMGSVEDMEKLVEDLSNLHIELSDYSMICQRNAIDNVYDGVSEYVENYISTLNTKIRMLKGNEVSNEDILGMFSMLAE